MIPEVTSTAWDYVIVGAGSAGCVLANRLTASGRHSVLLLEAGPADSSPWIHVPIGYAKTMFHPVYNWVLRDRARAAGMQRAKSDWPRGRALGGSSSINGLIYIRGQHEDYDRWARSATPAGAARRPSVLSQGEHNSRCERMARRGRTAWAVRHRDARIR